MSKRDVIMFLFKWKYSLIGYFLFVVALVTALVYLLPQKYEAMSSVLVESNRAPVMRSDTAFGTDELFVLNSAVAIIQSRTVLSAAVDKVGPGANDDELNAIEAAIQALRQWMQDIGLSEPITPREAMIEKLQDKLNVEPLASSNVITIGYSGKNPQWTTDVVNAITDSYIDHHLKVFSSKGTSEVYRLQTERLKKELDERRRNLADYKRRGAVSALAETRHALVQLQSDLITEQAEAREELATLKTQFSAGHTKIALAEQKLVTVQQTLDDTRAKLQSLEVQEASIAEMELGIGAIEKSYEQYQKRYEEERLNDLANPDVVNVRVIEYAMVPTRPAHSRIFYVALAAVGGLILTFAIALLREYFDHGVSDPGEVAELLGVPTLGSIERAGILS